jgi:hypothetical protein
VPSISTDTADDIGREVSLLGTVIFSVSNLTTVLAGLVFVVSKSTVEGGKLTKLIAFQLVLAFGYRRGLDLLVTKHMFGHGRNTYSLNDVVDEFFCLVDLFLGICHD